MRKGIDIDRLTELVNTALARADEELPLPDVPYATYGPVAEALPQAYRKALCDLLTIVQNETQRYSGFNYQASEWTDYADGNGLTLRDNYDDTRRVYRVKPYKR